MLPDKILELHNRIFYIIRNQFGHVIYPSDKGTVAASERILASKKDSRNRFYDAVTNRWYEYSYQEFEEDGVSYKVDIFIDETFQKQQEEHLQIDYVTKLKNRELTIQLVQEYVSGAILKGEEFALVMGDIDHFKNVNDTYGHDVGDMALLTIASYLQSVIRHGDKRPKDVAGRIGGEEFLILIKNIKIDDAQKKVLQLKDSMRESLKIAYEGKIIENITMSFGMCHLSAELLSKLREEDISEVVSRIMRKCDLALYHSKENGRDMLSIYDSTDTENRKRFRKDYIKPVQGKN